MVAEDLYQLNDGTLKMKQLIELNTNNITRNIM